MKRATTSCVSVNSGTLQISIHALMKRATNIHKSSPLAKTISIHALMKRATSFKFLASDGVGYFNPRPHEEGDFM